MLAGQDEVYLKAVLHAHASEARNKSTMHRMADQLSTMDIELIALHFTSQQPKAVIYIEAPREDDDSTIKFRLLVQRLPTSKQILVEPLFGSTF